jgi:ectoine hydroxylase-related dioxygenase (phytanoyl-CoA dioxygenase family)
MAQQLSTFEARTPAEEIIAAIDQDGGAILNDFLSSDVIDELVKDVTPHLDAVDWCNTDANDPMGETFFGRRTKRLHGLPARSARVADVLVHPILRAMSEHFLKPNCHKVHFSTGELMALGRGETEQVLHRDADSWIHFPKPRPELLVSVNLALTDFTADNGATVVIPGSHRWEPDRKPKPEESTKAIMPRGSALLYTGNILHGGGANETDETRIGLYCGLTLSWLRPLENHLITSGIETLRNLPEEARTLCGFSEEGWDVIP